MKCTNCQGEWTLPNNQSLAKCPLQSRDIINAKFWANELNDKKRLKNAYQISTSATLAKMKQIGDKFKD